jgi:hypothetical protein
MKEGNHEKRINQKGAFRVTKLRLVTPLFEAPLRESGHPVCDSVAKQSFENERYQAELGNEE